MLFAQHEIAKSLWKKGVPIPKTQKITPGRCTFCAASIEEGISMKWFSGTFTNVPEQLIMGGAWMCVYCATTFCEKAPVEGYDKPKKLRNFSHIFIGGTWHCVHAKTDEGKIFIRDTLTSPPKKPWIAVISETGQKHILFRAKWSPGGDCLNIQFEESMIRINKDVLFEHLINPVDKLKAMGFSKDEIKYIRPSALRLSKNIRATELFDIIKPYKESRYIDLACLLARKGNAYETTN